jgi:hypothetical protein
MFAVASLASAADGVPAAAKSDRRPPLFLTATNGTNNFLAVVNTQTKEVNYIPTGGAGGASGNAGGVAVAGSLAAVVNFASSNVTIFVRHGDSVVLTQTIKTASQPVSAAFGHDHLVVLGQTTAESFPVSGNNIATTADGTMALLKGDKSAAQIVAFDGGVAYSEKSGSVAELDLATNGIGSGLTGPSRAVTLPAPPNNDTPFGMIARGANLYMTIAHSNLEALVTNGSILSMAAGPTPYKDQSGAFLHAPCWNALSGQFLFAADSPGKQLYRYLVSDANIFFDKAVAPKFGGSPTDLAADGDLLGVIDGGDGTNSTVSVFDIDSEGELTRRFAVAIPAPINGAAIIR